MEDLKTVLDGRFLVFTQPGPKAVIFYLYFRKVVGWSTSARLQRDVVLEALKMALARRTLVPGLIHHGGRGNQYASHDFQNLLKTHGIKCSMSGAGNCYNNAVAESFFATLKRERVHRRQDQTREEAATDLFQYIEVFYNRKRRHTVGAREVRCNSKELRASLNASRGGLFLRMANHTTSFEGVDQNVKRKALLIYDKQLRFKVLDLKEKNFRKLYIFNNPK